MRHLFFFGAMYAITFIIDSFFCVSNICSDSFQNLSIWNSKRFFSGYSTAGCHFVCSIIHRLCHCVSFLLLILLSWNTTLNTIFVIVKKNQEETYLHHSTLQLFFPILFYHFPPICLELECTALVHPHFWASLLSLMENMWLATIFMRWGGVCKEGWLWGFLIKFSFRWIQNLSSGTFGWMLEHTLHGAVIIFDDVINDKKAII